MTEIALIFISAFIILLFVRWVANYIGLVDKPNKRKKHKGHIPLVGGISIYFSLWVLFICHSELLPEFPIYMFCASVLVLIGVLDDRLDLPVLPRILTQLLVAIIMISSGLYFDTLGNIFFGFEVYLGLFGIVITMLAVGGAINAFNMVDGIDGLLGMLSCVTIGSLVVIFYLNQDYKLMQWCLYFFTALIPFILLNIGFPFGKRLKVFMGDAGSTLIGFTVMWLLILATKSETAAIHPVTILWIIAVPLMDMIGIMFRRIYLGKSPFKPDRKHLHHIFMRAGFNSKQTLLIISLVALIFATIGIISDRYNVSESIMFFSFLLLLVAYIWSIKRIWKLLTWIRGSRRVIN